MNKETLRRYAELKNQEKLIADEIKKLQPEILNPMIDKQAEEIETEWGTFVLANRKKYKYPEAIIGADEALKIAKKEAEQTGDATYENNYYIKFNAND